MSLWRFSAREVYSRPGRAILTLLSIVLGVAAVVSVSIATTTTRGAYSQMYSTMAGRTTLEVVSDAGSDFDASVLEEVQKVPGIASALPVVQRPTIMYYNGKRVKLLAIGVDSSDKEALSDYDVSSGKLFETSGGVVLTNSFAKSVNLKTDDEIRLLTRRGLKDETIVGLLTPRGAASFNQGVMFMSLKRAQTLFAIKGRVDSIHLILNEKSDEEKISAELAKILPEGISARRPATRSQMAEETLMASEQGLQLASGLSLIVAGFIILNTFFMNVSERRRHLSVMRAIGATRSQIIWLLISEGACLGVIGTLLGLVTGIGGAYYLTRAVERLFDVPSSSLNLTPWPFIAGTLFGLTISLAATFFPARQAGRLSPLEGMRPDISMNDSAISRWVILGGAIIVTVCAIMLMLCMMGLLPIDISVAVALVGLLGLVQLLPVGLAPVARAVAFLLSPFFHIEGQLAYRQILRRRMRTTLTIGVLFVSVTAGIGVANSVLDNIGDVKKWYGQTLQADFFVRAMMPDMATGATADMPDGIGEELHKIPGIEKIDTVRFVGSRIDDTKVVIFVRDFSAHDELPLNLVNGEPSEVRKQLQAGEVVMGTVLAQRLKLHPGDNITVETPAGPKQLKIAAAVNEYTVGGLVLYMDHAAAKKLFDFEGVDVYVIKAKHDALPQVEASLEELCTRSGLLLQSFTDLIALIDGMMSGVVGSLWVILALGFVVAAFGIVNTLTMNVLEQTREIALLRIVAMTRRQVRRTILAQAAIMGLIGLAPGIITGILIAYLMNLVTAPIFGRTIHFVLHPRLLAGCFFGGLAVVVLAAWIPAIRASRLELVTALRRE